MLHDLSHFHQSCCCGPTCRYEADFSHAVGEVTLYMKNDFTDEFKHSETVVGAKITF